MDDLIKRTEVVARQLKLPPGARQWPKFAGIGGRLPCGALVTHQLTAPRVTVGIGEDMPNYTPEQCAAALNEAIQRTGLNRFGCPPPVPKTTLVLTHFARVKGGIWVRGTVGADVLGAPRYRYDIIGGRA